MRAPATQGPTAWKLNEIRILNHIQGRLTPCAADTIQRQEPHGGSPLAEPDHDDPKARLEALEAKLAEKRAANRPKPHMEEHYSQAQLAWRMVIELVAGLGIGFGMGYGLDMVLGTQPFLMIVFSVLGFIAGVRTMIRSAGEVQKDAEARAAKADTERE